MATRRKIACQPTISPRAGALNTVYAPDVNRDVLVVASIEISTGAGGSGKVEALSDSANPPTTVRATIALATASTDTTGLLVFVCKAGENYKLLTTNVAGTPTFTLIGNILEYVF